MEDIYPDDPDVCYREEDSQYSEYSSDSDQSSEYSSNMSVRSSPVHPIAPRDKSKKVIRHINVEKIKVSPLVSDDMTYYDLRNKYPSTYEIKTKDDKIKLLNDMLRSFRVMENGEPVMVIKKKDEDDDSLLVFDLVKENKFKQVLKSLYIKKEKQTTTKQKNKTIIETKSKPYSYLDIYVKYRDYFRVKSMIFHPMAPPKINIVNLFTGWKAKYQESLNLDKIKPVLRHIKEIFCQENQECYDYMIKWMAHLFQKPTEKPPIGIILQSEQGAGKDLFFGWFIQHLLGSKFGLTTQHFDKVVGRFNCCIQNKMLVVINEIVADGNYKKEDQYEIMKSLITESKQVIEKKGFDPIEFKSYSRFIFCSNSDKPLKIEQGDRRYFVLKFNKSLEPNYYSNLVSNLTQDTANHFFTYLNQLPIDDFNISQFPITQSRQEIQELSESKDIKFIKEHKWVGKISNKQLYQEYRNWCLDEGHNNPSNSTWFSRNISNYTISGRTGNIKYKERKFLPNENQEIMNLLIPNLLE
jgi:hypothetical protein